MGAAIAITSERDRRQVGAKRLAKLAEAGCTPDEETVRYLASLPARDRDAEIEKLLTAPVSVETLRRQRKFETARNRAIEESQRVREIERDSDQLARLIDEAATDERKLMAACQRLANRPSAQGAYTQAVRVFASMMRSIEEADLDADQRAIVEANRQEMIAAGLDPEADDEGEDQSTWQALASCERGKFADIDGNSYGLQRKLKQD